EEKLYNLLKPLFTQAKKSNYQVDELRPMQLLSLDSTKHFLDVGANKLRTINECGYDHPNVELLVGVDIVPSTGDMAYPDKTKFIQLGPDYETFPIAEQSMDVANIQFVLHHVENEREITKI